MFGQAEFALLPRPEVGERGHHLGDDVAGALDDDHVPDAQILAVDIVLVVERGLLDGHAAHGDRLQHGVRVEHARAPHVETDVQQPGLGGGGSELAGYGPARVPPHTAQGGLQAPLVELDHHAVDVVVQLGPAPFPVAAPLDYLVQAPRAAHVRVHAEAMLPQPLQHVPLGGERVSRDVADTVAP